MKVIFQMSRKAAIISFLVLCLFLLMLWFFICAVPSFDAVKAAYRPSESVLLDRHQEPIQVLRLDFEARRLNWVSLKDISPVFPKLLIASEDQHFYDHAGIDSAAFAKSVLSFFQRQKIRGGSTITMQLAGLLDEGVKPAEGQHQRSFFQKIAQIRLALAIERSWTKKQILEAYLNLVGFRGELEGIYAMSLGLFGQQPDSLDIRSSAIGVVLLRAPNAKADRVSKRACALIQKVYPQEGCEGLEIYTKIVLSRPLAIPYEHQLAHHMARRLLKEPGQTVVSSLDAQIQKAALSILRRHMADLTERQVEDGALIVLDNETGQVLAWVGSSGTTSNAAHMDGVVAPRQAGSTLKPFLYGLAIESKWLTAASVLDDQPLALQTGNGLYVPQNFDREFRGLVSVRSALASSLNIPAVSTLTIVSVEKFYQKLQEAGLSTLTQDAGFYGYSLALGSAEVSLQDLTNAYRMLANGGKLTPVSFFPDKKQDTGRQVFDAKTAFIVSDILADPNARIMTFGRQSALNTAIWAAVKTGTSRDMRDNWCIGYSRRYTVGVWVGNFSGVPMHDVSGVTGAAPIWQSMMAFLARYHPEGLLPPKPPAGLVHQKIRFEPPFEPAREEWFLPETAQAVFWVSQDEKTGAQGMQKIAYPVANTMIAIDVDIPLHKQRVFFAATNRKHLAGLSWKLNGQLIGAASAHSGWFPVPGKYRLELVHDQGTIDSVSFEVKAGGAKLARQKK